MSADSKPRLSDSHPQRRFVHLSRAWYADTALRGRDLNDEVRLGLDWIEPEDGCEYEFLIVWHQLAGKSTPQLTMFNDSWRAIREMADVMEWLADHDREDVTPEEVCEALLGLGFVDGTEVTHAGS